MVKKSKEEFLQGLSFNELVALAKDVHVQDMDFDKVDKQDLVKRLRWFSYKLLMKRYKKIKL